MKVGFDASPLLNPLTGVGHYALNVLKEMLTLDQEISFEGIAVTMGTDKSQVPASPRFKLRHIRGPARWVVPAWDLAGLPSVSRFIGRIDLFHAPNFVGPPSGKVPGVVTIHDLTFWLYPEMCTPAVQRYRRLVPRQLSRTAAVIVPSKTVKDQVTSELSFPSDRVFVTPEGVSGVFRSQSSAKPGDYLIFAGTQEPRKNLSRLLEALSSVPEARLVIVGPPGWGSIDLPALARNLKLHDRVEFRGYVPSDELALLVANARAFVYPSIYEGFGLPPLEAMAAGVPVVAARAGPLPEVLGDAPIWCDPLDVESIAAAITLALEDEAERSRAISRGRERSSLYKWSNTAAATLEVYSSVV